MLDRESSRIPLLAGLGLFLGWGLAPNAIVQAQGARATVEAASPFQGHHRYRLVDIGTFGGQNSQFSTPSASVLSRGGVAAGIADTDIPDPTCYFDCVIDHAFEWKDGVITRLPELPGGQSSFGYVVNDRGLIVGVSQIGTIDPLTGVREQRGAAWRRGKVAELHSLGGNVSGTFAVNDRDEIVGAATNEIPDPFADALMAACRIVETSTCDTFAFSNLFSPTTTETRAVLWHDGSVHDLGTLGGPDSTAEMINERGDVTGYSYTSFTANPSTGTPTVDPFFWSRDGEQMIDMGGLGGTFGAPFWMNNRGEVVGASNLAGDIDTHPFIWSREKGMEDLGTLGGTFGHPDWINDAGDVVGTSTDAGGHLRAFLWHAGKMTNLGTVGTDPDSEALSINAHGQIVGGSYELGVADLHGFLWENGGPMVDLNALVHPKSTVKVIFATQINEGGEIAGTGLLPNGDTHAILLIPCDD